MQHGDREQFCAFSPRVSNPRLPNVPRPTCEHAYGFGEGTRTGSDFTFSYHEVATTLLEVSRGESYREASARGRLKANRCTVGPEPPPLLYVRGSTETLRATDMVAVIGTREPTPGGEVVARRLAAAMVEAGFAVVSGLAKGIDTAAHVGALEAGGNTVAYLGTSIDKIYPAATKTWRRASSASKERS